MTSEHPVRRLLQRVCSADTMSRVVDPVLADIRWETRPGWLGYCVLLKALSVHAVTSTPGAIGRVYSDDGHAVPKAAAFAIAAALIAAALLVGVPFISTIQRAPVPHAHPYAEGLLVIIPALVVTLPAALLVAIPLALKRREPSARLARRVVGLSIGWAAITFAILVWVTPEANQAYRELTAGKAIARGPSEQGLSGLKREIERLRTFHGAEPIVRRLEYGYQIPLTLASAAVPLGLLALALARLRAGRRRPVGLGSATLVLYFLILFLFHRVMSTGQAAPPLIAWLPNLFVGLLAAFLLARFRTSRSAPSTEHSAPSTEH